jgi:hypothetical protein
LVCCNFFSSSITSCDWSDFCHWGFTLMATLGNPQRCLAVQESFIWWCHEC